jgi:hypothetical protein
MSTEQLNVNLDKIDGQMQELIEYVLPRPHVATTSSLWVLLDEHHHPSSSWT